MTSNHQLGETQSQDLSSLSHYGRTLQGEPSLNSIAEICSSQDLLLCHLQNKALQNSKPMTTEATNGSLQTDASGETATHEEALLLTALSHIAYQETSPLPSNKTLVPSTPFSSNFISPRFATTSGMFKRNERPKQQQEHIGANRVRAVSIGTSPCLLSQALVPPPPLVMDSWVAQQPIGSTTVTPPPQIFPYPPADSYASALLTGSENNSIREGEILSYRRFDSRPLQPQTASERMGERQNAANSTYLKKKFSLLKS